MDLSLTLEQKKLQESARDFLKRECPWTLVKQIDDSETGFSSELWQKIVSQGWVGASIPEKYGGTGRSVTDLGILYEEIGQALLPGPYFSSAVLCASIILELGTEQQKRRLLPAMAQGKKILALALTEPDYGWGPECIHLSAYRKGGNFVLNGAKLFVHDAQIADQIICVARTRKSINPTGGISLFLVDKDAPGISCRSLSGFTGEKLNELTFKSVEVPESNMLGERDKGWTALAKPLNKAMVLLSAFMVGGCEQVLNMTVKHAQTRIQFGMPVGSFQWVQGYIIEQANHLERARWFTYEAMWKLDAKKSEREQDEAVALAKAISSEAYHECAHLAHEVHAGIGVQKGYPLYLYSKKAKTLYAYLGDPAYHRKRIAQLLRL
jgi:alkylation response protein AidB-like acyl-CoA dehydrogenase